MRSDGRDIRITTVSGANVPLFIDSVGAGVINVILKLPANIEKLLLYYGNGACKTVSSGAGVFDFWEDFTGSAINTAVWNTGGSGFSVSNSILTINNSSDSGYIQSKSTFAPGSLVEIKIAHQSGQRGPFGFRDNSTQKTAAWQGAAGGLLTDHRFAHNGSSGDWDNDGVNRSGTAYNVYGVAHIAAGPKFYVNYSYRGEITTTIPGSVSLPVHVYSYSGEGYQKVDWIRVRKYSASMPTITFGRKYLNQPKRYPYHASGTAYTSIECRPKVSLKFITSLNTRLEMRPKVAIRRPLFYNPSIKSPYPTWKFEGKIELVSEARPALVNLPKLPNMTADGRDLRITDMAGKDLDFGIETSNDTNIRVWVDAPATINRLRFFYGNGIAVSASNPAVTGELETTSEIIPHFVSGRSKLLPKWKYEGEYRLSGTATGGEQILITVPRYPNMAVDGRDIRLTDSAGKFLSYFIESSSSTAFSVWVKLTAGLKKIKLFFGNGTAKALSSAVDVFDFIDDFNSLDTGKWTVLNGSASASGSVLSIGSTTKNTTVQSVSAYDSGNIVEMRANHPDGNESYKGFWNLTSGKRAVWKPSTTSPYNDYVVVHNGTSQSSANDGVNRSGSYYKFGVKYEAAKCSFYVDDVLRQEITTNVPSGEITIGFYSTVNKGNVLVDWVRVRKVTAITATLIRCRSRADSIYFEEVIETGSVPEIKVWHKPQLNTHILYYESLSAKSAIELSVSEPVIKIRRELRDYQINAVDVTRSINDSYTQLSTEFKKPVYPPEKSTIKHNAYDKDGNPHLLFFGKIQTENPVYRSLGTTVEMQAADQSINLSVQKIPWNCQVIDGNVSTYPTWINMLLEPAETGVYPNTIIDTGKAPTQIVLDSKTTRLDAIKKIAEYTGCVYHTKLISRVINGETVIRPEFYFVPPQNIDDAVNGFNLPAPITLSPTDPTLADEPKLISTPEEKYNKVTVSGTLSDTGEFVIASAFSYKVYTGEEKANEYFIEDNTIFEKGSTVEQEAVKWLLYFLAQRAKVSMKFVNRFDFELYQRIRFGLGFPAGLQALTRQPKINYVAVCDPRDKLNSTHLVDVSGVPRPGWMRISELKYHSEHELETVEVTVITDFIYSASDAAIPEPYSKYLSPGYMKPVIDDIVGTTQSIVDDAIEKQLTPESGTVLSIDTENGTAVVQLASGKIVTVDLA
jgi:hypothetical protein